MPVHGLSCLRTIRESRQFILPDALPTDMISRYDGIPAVSDYHTLTEILREEWGYEYFVMTDAGGSDRVCSYFKLCESDPLDMESVTEQILTAGIDVEMGGGSL